MSIIKQVIGVDISSQKFDVLSATIDSGQDKEFGKVKVYRNDSAGIGKFESWLKNHRQAGVPLIIAMEATGVYYEELAFTLYEKGYTVNVIQPNKTKAYAKSLRQKSKTDALDAKMIASYSLERKEPAWQPPEASTQEMRELSRERKQLKEHCVALKNQLHAHSRSVRSMPQTIKRLEQHLELLKQQIKQIDQEILAVIKRTPALYEGFKCMTSIDSIGETTAAYVLAETDAFSQVERAGQLTSYAGLDPVLCQSGTYKGKEHISGKGNAHLRHALYMPAVAAIRCNPHMKALFQRLVKRKAHKRIAVIAVMRKLLILMWTLWKTKRYYDPNYRMPA